MKEKNVASKVKREYAYEWKRDFWIREQKNAEDILPNTRKKKWTTYREKRKEIRLWKREN